MRCLRLFLLASVLLAATFSSCRKEGTISVSTDLLEADYWGEDITITVTATAHWKVIPNYPRLEGGGSYPGYIPTAGKPTTDIGWITCSVEQGDAGATQLTVHIDATTGFSREASVVFELTDSEQFLIVPVRQQGKQDRDMTDMLTPGMVKFLGPGHMKFGNIMSIKSLDLRDQQFDFSSDLVYFEGLEIMYCDNSGLTAIDVEMPRLRVLEMSGCKVKHLDPALFPELEDLGCAWTSLESLDILTAPKLRTAFCEGVPVKELSLGPQLRVVSLRDCGLERLDISGAAGLVELDCAYNNLEELGVIDSGKFWWGSSDFSVNPGRDGVFTVYVTEDPGRSWENYTRRDWKWKGKDVTVRFVEVPSS